MLAVATGTVLSLWRYPVKSMGGERLGSTRVDAAGIAGDRAHALTREHKGQTKPLTAREAPGMLAWRASYPFAPDFWVNPAAVPAATLHGPDGNSLRWGDPRLRARLEEDLGREVGFSREPDGTLHDLPRTMLVTTEASRAALEAEIGEPVDVRRFRPNVHLDLDADAWEELTWEGGQIAFAAGVRLELLHPCVRCVIPTIEPGTRRKWPALLKHLAREHETCFGINARVTQGGRLEAGEAAAVAAPGRVSAARF